MEQKSSSLSAAVLAGGFSTRMGNDKAALPVAGMTMLVQQVRKLRALGIGDIMISGAEQEIAGTRFVPDVYPHRGPLSGIHACLAAAKREAVLFLSVDTPLVPAEALKLLISAHEDNVTLLRSGEQTEPLIGIYDRALSPLCEAILQGERTGVWQLLNRTTVKTVPFSGDPALLLNVNTPEDYAQLLQIQERQLRI